MSSACGITNSSALCERIGIVADQFRTGILIGILRIYPRTILIINNGQALEVSKQNGLQSSRRYTKPFFQDTGIDTPEVVLKRDIVLHRSTARNSGVVAGDTRYYLSAKEK